MAYTEDEKAAALTTLAFHDGNCAKASKAVGVSHAQLRRWAKSIKPDAINQNVALKENVAHKKETLAEKCETIIYTLLDALPSKIADSTLQQLSTSLGILIDKMLILRAEKPTINQASLTDAERAQKISEILTKAGMRIVRDQSHDLIIS